jgi:signal transduction histidine kinase
MTSAARDAYLACACVLAGGLFFVKLDTAERITASVLHWESIQLDDLLLTSGLAVCATSWFALRRWRDAQRSLRAERESEREKARYVVQLEELSAQLLTAEQTERARIAEHLHDEVGQTLYACRLQLELAQSRAQDRELGQLLAEAYALAGSAMANTRELSAQLSPPILHDLGLSDAIEWLLSRTEQRFGVKTHFAAGPAWRQVQTRLHEPVFASAVSYTHLTLPTM